MANILQVDEETLQQAIDYYHAKYGLCVIVDTYIICFEPLGVLDCTTETEGRNGIF